MVYGGYINSWLCVRFPYEPQRRGAESKKTRRHCDALILFRAFSLTWSVMIIFFFVAVVYHDGKEAGKGHYVTEVHHAGTGTWLRFDDSFVRAVADSQLFKYSLPRMPYLLLYRRADTISPAVNSSRSSAAASSASSAAYLNTPAHHNAGGRGLDKS